MPAKFVLLCLATFAIGYLLSMYLFRRKKLPFGGSQIQIKIHTWIPIFLIIVLVARRYEAVNILLLILVISAVIYEFVHAKLRKRAFWLSLLYLLVVIAGILSLGAIAADNVTLFVYVWFLSVLSDVGAYFAGNFFGRHSLPKQINPSKSWEGAAGQLAGSLLGYILVQTFVAPIPGWLWIAVGLGSLGGDLANSYIKRRNSFKDWSKAIPGHGGFLDRLSSLSFAAVLVYLLTR